MKNLYIIFLFLTIPIISITAQHIEDSKELIKVMVGKYKQQSGTIFTYEDGEIINEEDVWLDAEITRVDWYRIYVKLMVYDDDGRRYFSHKSYYTFPKTFLNDPFYYDENGNLIYKYLPLTPNTLYVVPDISGQVSLYDGVEHTQHFSAKLYLEGNPKSYRYKVLNITWAVGVKN